MLGGFMQAAVQVPLIWKKGFKPLWPQKFWTQKSKKIVKLIGPGLIGFAATQVNLLITTILATPIVGATSWLNYSFRLFQLPVGILSVSIGNSNLVHFSEAWKKGDKDKAKSQLQQSYYLSFLTVMPALVILYCLSEEIVNVIFERGRFDRESTLMTSEALRMYALGLPFYGLYKIWVPTFYALDRQKIPVIASLFSIGFNISFCLLLTPVFGFKILALGTTLSVLVNAGFQSFVLKKDLALSWKFFLSPALLKVIGATLGSAIVVEFFLKYDFYTQTFITRCFYLGAQIFAVCILYVGFLIIFGERQAASALLGKILKKFQRTK
jgi:putative peptidoglycan lipid II flippase